MDIRGTALRILDYFPAALARLGLVERAKATEAFDLAVPAMVTGAFRVMLRITDFLFIGLAIGDEGIAGLELGYQYFFIGFGLSLALTSGTISVVSRLQGAGERARANLAVKQSLWLSLVVAVPLTVLSWVYAGPLLDVLTDDPRVIDLGAAYLQVVMLALVFRFFNLIASRALAGSADTRTPMYVRAVSVPTNVVLTAALVFGLGPAPELGVVGAAAGTVVANGVASAVFFGLLVSGRYAVALRLGGRQFDAGLAREIVRVALPLTGTRLLQSSSRFPFLYILNVLGTPAVAAYAIARRAMMLARMPAWGYSTAASTLVGQSLGSGDEDSAADYGWQTLRVGLATQMLLAALLMLFARPIAAAFGTEHVDLTVDFIRVFGLGMAGFSVSRTMRGSLRGAGDTRWPLYGTFLGMYVVRLPVAMLALPTAFTLTLAGVSVSPGLGLGVSVIYLSILGDFYTKAAVNAGRFWSGRWREVARRSGVGVGSD